jgi:AraC-like DNA-binding protein
MDSFGGLLDGPRARGAFALRTVMTPPWSLRILAKSPLTVLAMVRGHAWVVPDDGDPVRLDRGDVAVTRAPDHYSVADDPATPTTVEIRPGQHCFSPEGESLEEAMMHGVRTWGNDPEGSTLMLVGAYESEGDISDRLLRAWFTRPDAEAPKWYRSQADPIVGKTLTIMHRDPAQSWTVARLATEVGVSRAALGRRFQDVVGESPMKFLTEWRLALAADLLCEPDATVGTVAEKVGYGSPFALSAAFKRVRGLSPQEHRARAMSPA